MAPYPWNFLEQNSDRNLSWGNSSKGTDPLGIFVKGGNGKRKGERPSKQGREFLTKECEERQGKMRSAVPGPWAEGPLWSGEGRGVEPRGRWCRVPRCGDRSLPWQSNSHMTHGSGKRVEKEYPSMDVRYVEGHWYWYLRHHFCFLYMK